MTKDAKIICAAYIPDDLLPEDAPDELKAGELYEIEVEIFRTGNFNHFWYGELVFDEAYLDNMINNYNKKIYNQKISFDADHIPHKEGALAWLKDEPGSLFKRSKVIKNGIGEESTVSVLVAKTMLNKYGYDKVRNHVYKYFSSEIDNDYKPYEYVIEKNEAGEEIKKEATSFGPTLISGGLTNRPFIPNLSEMSFSNIKDKEFNDKYHYSSSEELGGMFFSSYAAKKELPVNELETQKFNDENNGDDTMKLSDLMKEVAQKNDAEKVQIFSQNLNSLDADAKSLIEDQIELLNEKIRLSNQLSKNISENESLKKQQETMTEKYSALEKQLVVTRESNYKQTVELYSASLRDMKCSEATISYLEEVLTELEPAQRDMKFSVGSGDKAKTIDLMAFAKGLIETLPKESFVDETEVAEANSTNVVQVVPEPPKQEEPKNAIDSEAWVTEGHRAFSKLKGMSLEQMKAEGLDKAKFTNDGRYIPSNSQI